MVIYPQNPNRAAVPLYLGGGSLLAVFLKVTPERRVIYSISSSLSRKLVYESQEGRGALSLRVLYATDEFQFYASATVFLSPTSMMAFDVNENSLIIVATGEHD